MDPFLNSGFSLATLQESGTDDSEIKRLIRSVMGLDSILEPSLRKMPDRPSMPAALFVSNFSRISTICFSFHVRNQKAHQEDQRFIVISDIIHAIFESGSWKLFD